ncbi:hypothetical protein ACFL54_04945 [Planctomycetota bacterium]
MRKLSTMAGMVLFTLFIGIAISLVIAQGDDENEKIYRQGKKAFRGCAMCHCVTEPKIKEDEDWLKLNQITACVNAGESTPEIRKALDVFFRSPKTRRPLLVDENYVPREGRACGRIKLPATSGTAYLKAERESIRKGSPAKIRLYWKKSDNGKVLTIPAGRYQVITYRYFRKDKTHPENLWTMSVTDVNGCIELNIAEGKEEIFGLKPVLQGNLTVSKTGAAYNVALDLRSETKSILTLSKSGELIIPQLLIVDSTGKEIFKGEFENT